MAAPASQINSGSEMIASGNIVIILVSFIHPSKLEYDHHSQTTGTAKQVIKSLANENSTLITLQDSFQDFMN